MTANELDLKVQKYLRHYDIHPLMDELSLVGAGQKLEVLNQNPRGGNLYYQWLACLVRFLQPKQIVELGPASGISTIMMLSELPKTSKLISVDIDSSIAWKWIKNDYPQLVKVLGDDLDLSIYPKDVKLEETDLWFFDTLHTKDQLQKEFDLYKKYFKRGTVVVVDDIRMEGLWDVWKSLPYDKCETTHPNHYSGFGHFIV